jgi:hypothetical protein
MDTNRKARPKKILNATPNQKRGGRKDRFTDTQLSSTVPVDTPLLASQRKKAPANRKRHRSVIE